MIVASKARATWRRIDAGKLEAASDLAHDDMHFRFVGETPFGADLRGKDAFLAGSGTRPSGFPVSPSGWTTCSSEAGRGTRG
jgi:hypothetical protein